MRHPILRSTPQRGGHGDRTAAAAQVMVSPLLVRRAITARHAHGPDADLCHRGAGSGRRRNAAGAPSRHTACYCSGRGRPLDHGCYPPHCMTPAATPMGQCCSGNLMGFLSLDSTLQVTRVRATNRDNQDPKWPTYVQNFIQRLFCNASVSRLSRLRKYNKPARGAVGSIVQATRSNG